jgi:ATP-dependent DNA helicase RecG
MRRILRRKNIEKQGVLLYIYTMNAHKLDIVLAEGEGQKVEFKEGITGLNREMVAFANSSGGSIFAGVKDDESVCGLKITNTLLSRVSDIARNCDPPVKIACTTHRKNVLEIAVDEGVDKPYRCKEGFFLRTGPNSQKMTRNEIRSVMLAENAGYYDERWNSAFSYPDDFDSDAFENYLQMCGITTGEKQENLLLNLDLARREKGKLVLNNAGVLFFAKRPRHFFRESYITCIRYRGEDRFEIVDRQDIYGNPITGIENSISFIKRNIRYKEVVGSSLQHESSYEYPLSALREAVINAVAHRDYFYDASHIYVHIFSNRLEIENPGGLHPGLRIEELGERSVRRNRLIADILYRAGYIERIGSGIQRIRAALAQNNNPPFQVSSSNFFVIRFFPPVGNGDLHDLSMRQIEVVRLAQQKGSISKQETARYLDVSDDTALREITRLCERGILVKKGRGRGTKYILL